jgi:Lon protease-like protein
MAKGNPNPSPATRFSADRPGRAKQKGARDRLTADFLDAMANSFEKHGKAAIEEVRTKDPATYLRVVAALVPKEIQLSRPLDAVPDEKLAELIALLTDAVNGGRITAPSPKGDRTIN